jgi:Fe2+ transport system protein B
MSLLATLIVWALVTVVLLVVVTYRGFLGKDETDRMYINQTQDRLAMQQQEIISKVSRLDQFVKGLSVASGALLVICLLIWVYTSFSNL